jgi:hypothetical protein
MLSINSIFLTFPIVVVIMIVVVTVTMTMSEAFLFVTFAAVSLIIILVLRRRLAKQFGLLINTTTCNSTMWTIIRLIEHFYSTHIHSIECSWCLADVLACSQKVSHPEMRLVSAAFGASFHFPF